MKGYTNAAKITWEDIQSAERYLRDHTNETALTMEDVVSYTTNGANPDGARKVLHDFRYQCMGGKGYLITNINGKFTVVCPAADQHCCGAHRL